MRFCFNMQMKRLEVETFSRYWQLKLMKWWENGILVIIFSVGLLYLYLMLPIFIY